MNPYYQDSKGITLYHGHCEDVLPNITSQAMRYVVITDPPYKTRATGVPIRGRGVTERKHDSVSIGQPWGYALDWIDLLAPEHWIVYCNYQMLGGVCSTLEQRTILGSVFTWRKPNAPRMTRPVPRLDCEFIVWARSKRATCERMGEFDSLVLDIPMPQAGCFADERLIAPGGGRALHPTQKPVAVVRPFVDRLNAKLIIDPFMGTGTTLRAARALGVPAIGIDKDESYCEAAARSLSTDFRPAIVAPACTDYGPLFEVTQ